MAASKLTRELAKGIARRKAADPKWNLRRLATEAGQNYGWIRSVVTGAIVTPPAKKLVTLADPLGIPAERLLALTEQLGASLGEVGERRPEPDLAGAISALVTELQAMRTEREGVEARLRALEAEVQSVREQLAGGGSPRQPVPQGSGQ